MKKGGGIIRKKLETGKITQWKIIVNSESKRQEKKERIQKAFDSVASVEVIPATAVNSSETHLKVKMSLLLIL